MASGPWAAAAATLLLAAASAGAHEPGSDAVPALPGWQAGAAVALQAVDADAAWPTPQWPGVLVLGQSPRDRRGRLVLEHATLSATARLNAMLGAELSLGWHDRDRAHVEAARLEVRWPLGPDRLLASLGRDTVRMGRTLDGAGHFDAFGQAPLAKRAVLDEQWLDDGLRLAWQRDVERGPQQLELGLWRGRHFPGGPAGPAMPTLHLQLGWDHWSGHLFAAHAEPEGRGAAAQSAAVSGHSHSVPDCRQSLQRVVCFDGRVELAGASLHWTGADERFSAAVAGLARQEHGALYSSSGDAAYRGTVAGAWAEAGWRWRPAWLLSARAERLVPRLSLQGVGASLVAREAGLADAAPVERLSLALAHDWRPGLRLGIEASDERGSTGHRSQLGLRLVWQDPQLLQGRW